jgi:hypothetical protein
LKLSCANTLCRYIPNYIIILFAITCLLVILKGGQVLLTLITIEFMFVVLIAILRILGINISPIVLIRVLAFVVGSAGVGLRLLVSCVRRHGSDFYKTFNVL